MMSDEDREIDILSEDENMQQEEADNPDDSAESDDSEDEDSDDVGTGRAELQFATQAEKRAHHNALERKRRDSIKDSYCSLRDVVPEMKGKKVSRAQILKMAADHIVEVTGRRDAHKKELSEILSTNTYLEEKIQGVREELRLEMERLKREGKLPGAITEIKEEAMEHDEGSDSEGGKDYGRKRLKL